ncbi:MAG TPA: carboxypeptidase-like regulatory domain-containing protein [Candidatus Angelobacter sp.]
MPHFPKSLVARSALFVACLLFFTGVTSAQFIRIEAGASDMVPSQGGTINFEGQNYKGYLGAGELDGAFRFGSYFKTMFDGFGLAVGDQNQSFTLPTDLFGGSQYFSTRGVGVAIPGDAKVFVFGGVTTLAVGGPLFLAFQRQTPVGMIFVDKAITDNLHFYSRNVFSGQQSWIQGFDWRARKWLKTAVSAGAGSNKPYLAASVDADRNWYTVKAAYIQASDSFRRITTPSIFASEPDRENILLTVKPYSSLVLTAGHENFLAPQGSLTAPFQRASVDQLQSSFDLAKFRLGAGLFQSHGPFRRNVADGFTVSRHVVRGIDASASYYQNLSGPRPRTSYLIGTVRETISPRVSLLQVVNRTMGNTTVLFGGSYTSNRFSVSVDYHTVYMPFLANPLQTGIGITLNLKLWGGFQVNGQTFRSPDGKLRYTASASTLLTPNLRPVRGNEAQAFKIAGYVVRGHVRDEQGAPIEGAAVRVGDQTVYSNAAGEFLVRFKNAGILPLITVTQEFLTPLNFVVVSMPSTVTAVREDSAPDVLIVLRPIANGKR